MTDHLSTALLTLLREQLLSARAYDEAARARHAEGTSIHVPGTGRILSSAYEQLRNAAEYSDEHLLLQRAIRRFFNRNLFMTHAQFREIGNELIVELVQAGYLRGGEFGTGIAATISELAVAYHHTYNQLRQAHVPRDQATDWVLSILSVETDNLLNPHFRLPALAYVAHQHFMEIFPRQRFLALSTDEQQYEISLYVAIHQSLFKSDIAIVRHDLMRLYNQSPNDLQAFITFNKNVNQLYLSSLTHRLKRAVSKQGAALRVLKSLAESRHDLPEILPDREKFIDAFRHQTDKEYSAIASRVHKGIVKSIIFILITKVLIGVGIEVPYDLLMIGSVDLLPLIINLAVPPLYMASLRLGLRAPSPAQGQILSEYIETVLYTDNKPTLAIGDPGKTYSASAKLLYGILFFVPFALTIYGLKLIHFNPLQMIIFFVFLSTASFLGFRLSNMIRELELGSRHSGMISTLRDFFYLPFILFGQWLTGKYAKINVVGYFLDIAIELPLKTVLRLNRQWVNFLNEKRDEIY
jgi:hypothetical protein